jgi:putative DNA methylase
MTVFYAFKQTEEDSSGSASTGWETMLNGLISAGFSITATWPIRTELSNRMIGSGANALASSIVLSCRPKEVGAEAVTRRSFVSALKSELPVALRNLQHGNVAPVDLAQAAIGPGMSVFTRYSRVIEADGSDMDVRMALALINQVLDEVLTEQEGDFDSETRFCIKWFTQYGWNSSNSGEADLLSRAVNTSLVTLERGGVFSALAGTATLIHPKDMASGWDPLLDKGISIWEVTVQLAYILQNDGIEKAQEMIVASSKRVEIESVKELSYLLFSISEKKGWTESAIMFNALGTSWSDFNSAIHAPVKVSASQEQLEL